MPFPLTCQNDNTRVSHQNVYNKPIKRTGLKKSLRPKVNLNTKGEMVKGKGKGTAYGPQFLTKAKQIASNLHCDYKDLIAIMNSESKIDSTLVAKNGASGLICFMPQFFDVKKIRKMSPLQQLDEVQKAVNKAKKMAGYSTNANLSKGDLYSLIFVPNIAKPGNGNQVLCKKGDKDTGAYYKGNAGLDINHDGKITKDEMSRRINNKYVNDLSFYA